MRRSFGNPWYSSEECRNLMIEHNQLVVQNRDFYMEQLSLLAPGRDPPVGDYHLSRQHGRRYPHDAVLSSVEQERARFIALNYRLQHRNARVNENGKRLGSETLTCVDASRRKRQRKNPTITGEDLDFYNVTMKLKVGEFDFSMPYHCMTSEDVNCALLRLDKLQTLSSDKLQSSKDLLWDIMKICSIFQFDSMAAIMHQDGLNTVPLKISNHLTFVRSLNVSHSPEVNDTNLRALPDYCKHINYINVDDCLNLSTTGILIVRSLSEFKGCYVNSVERPRIFAAKILPRSNPIEILDHDSTQIIFEMLPICGKLKLAYVCLSWKDISDNYFLNLKTLDLSTCKNKISLETFFEILVKSKKSLEHIDFTVLENSTQFSLIPIFRYMKKHLFENLLTLNLSGILLTDRLLGIFMAKQRGYPELKKLTIGAHKSSLDNNYVIRTALDKVKNLEYMEVTGNKSITGNLLIDRFKYLETLKLTNCSKATEQIHLALVKMPHLKNLSITNCRNSLDTVVKIQSSSLKFLQLSNNEPLVTIEKCDILEVLDLSQNCQVDDKYLMSVRKNCPNLVRVNISFCSQVTDIGLRSITSLPKIEHLSMNFLSLVSDKYLTMYRLKTLECRNCIRFYNAGVIQLLSTASSLELLDLTNCRFITQHLVEYAIKETKKRTNGITLKMYVGGTNVQVNQRIDESPHLQLVDLPEPCIPRKEVETDQHHYYASIDQFDED